MAEGSWRESATSHLTYLDSSSVTISAADAELRLGSPVTGTVPACVPSLLYSRPAATKYTALPMTTGAGSLKPVEEFGIPDWLSVPGARSATRCVPAAVPGIAFLSGGQSDEEATAHLDAMNRHGPFPWRLTFSYGRALQAAPQKAWAGKSENVAAAQRAFAHRAAMNSLATLGQWKQELEKTMDQVARPSRALGLWKSTGALSTLIPALAALDDRTIAALDRLAMPGLARRPRRRLEDRRLPVAAPRRRGRGAETGSPGPPGRDWWGAGRGGGDVGARRFAPPPAIAASRAFR